MKNLQAPVSYSINKEAIKIIYDEITPTTRFGIFLKDNFEKYESISKVGIDCFGEPWIKGSVSRINK